MDQVKFNAFSEIIVEDFARQAGYVGDAFKMFIADFLCQNTAVLGLDVTAEATPDMTVYVKPGRVYQSGQQGLLIVNLNPALTITAAHPTYDRIDRICAQYKETDDTPETRNVMVDTVSRQVIQKSVMTRTAGAIDFMVVSGVAAPGPAAPTVPDGWASLAQVKVRAATTSILQTDILDERPTLKSLATHAHSGGIDGAKIDYNNLLNKPADYSHTWQAKTAYSAGDICYPKTGASYIRMECTVPGTTGQNEPIWPVVGQTVTDGTVTWIVRDIKDGGGEQIGSIKPWLAKTAPAGWLALDTGALVSRATYPDLWNWVQANAPLLSETDWQAQAAAQTSVGAYSTGDGSTTFRLPRILDYVRGGLTTDVGKWQSDAIRNITGMAYGVDVDSASYNGNCTGALYYNNVGVGTMDQGMSSGQTDQHVNLYFDASKVVPTADENRPKTVKMLYCVKAFDATTNQGTVDITALANEMAAKVDKTDYTADFAKSLAANGYQKLPSGLILQWGYANNDVNAETAQVIFPIAFPSNCFSVNLTPYGDNGSSAIAAALGKAGFYYTSLNATINGFYPVYFIAVGD